MSLIAESPLKSYLPATARAPGCFILGKNPPIKVAESSSQVRSESRADLWPHAVDTPAWYSDKTNSMSNTVTGELTRNNVGSPGVHNEISLHLGYLLLSSIKCQYLRGSKGYWCTYFSRSLLPHTHTTQYQPNVRKYAWSANGLTRHAPPLHCRTLVLDLLKTKGNKEQAWYKLYPSSSRI